MKVFLCKVSPSVRLALLTTIIMILSWQSKNKIVTKSTYIVDALSIYVHQQQQPTKKIHSFGTSSTLTASPFRVATTSKRRTTLYSSTTQPLSSSSSSSNNNMKFKDFDSMIEQYPNEPILVYFYSNMCHSCTVQKQELIYIRNQIRQSGHVPYTKHILMIDTDQFINVAIDRYHITKLPCLIVMKNHQVLLRLDGFTSAQDLLQHFYTLTSSSSSLSEVDEINEGRKTITS